MGKKKILIIVGDPKSASIKDSLQENFEVEVVSLCDLPAKRASISSYAMVVSLLIFDYKKVVEALQEIPLAPIEFPTLSNHSCLGTIAGFISMFIERFKPEDSVPLFWNVSPAGMPRVVKFSELLPD